MRYMKPNRFCYRITQAASWVVAAFIFKRKVRRNEIRDRKKGPFVVIANHQAQLDFVNLIGLTRRPMTFVISNSFYNSLPIKGFMDKIGVIPKQQFQTGLKDMKNMKAVIDCGEPLVIYPAGLMCEDGVSTPIPQATYKFLKWLNADIYVARTEGTYFSMPKWASGMRPGRTYIDVYRLFTKEELAAADLETVREKTEEALLFDAYHEQEHLKEKYKNNDVLEGLENVLYFCPNCGKEFSMEVRNKHTICCKECGYAERSDEYGFLHLCSETGEEIRYVSDWSKKIYEDLKRKIENGTERALSAKTKIYMIDYKKHKFCEVGEGIVSIQEAYFRIEGMIRGEKADLTIPISMIPTLPFKPGRYFEIQHGENIYRCVLEDGKQAMKFINMVKIFYEDNSAEKKNVK